MHKFSCRFIGTTSITSRQLLRLLTCPAKMQYGGWSSHSKTFLLLKSLSATVPTYIVHAPALHEPALQTSLSSHFIFLSVSRPQHTALYLKHKLLHIGYACSTPTILKHQVVHLLWQNCQKLPFCSIDRCFRHKPWQTLTEKEGFFSNPKHW